jgi:hypothetical protein
MKLSKEMSERIIKIAEKIVDNPSSVGPIIIAILTLIILLIVVIRGI